MTSCKSEALFQKRKVTNEGRGHDNVRPLKNNKSRKRKLEHWKSRGRSGQAADDFRESKKFKLPIYATEKEVEVSIAAIDVSEPEIVLHTTPEKVEKTERQNQSKKSMIKPTFNVGFIIQLFHYIDVVK